MVLVFLFARIDMEHTALIWHLFDNGVSISCAGVAIIRVWAAYIRVWAAIIRVKPGLYSVRAYARVYARIRAHTPTVGAAVYTSVAGCAQRIRAHTPTVADKVQTCWTFKASADQRRHSSQSRKRSNVTEGWRVVLIGTYADVYRRIRSPVYTFIHGATCAMQWRRTGSRKRGHLRRLPTHTRAWSINPA